MNAETLMHARWPLRWTRVRSPAGVLVQAIAYHCTDHGLTVVQLQKNNDPARRLELVFFWTSTGAAVSADWMGWTLEREEPEQPKTSKPQRRVTHG